MLDVIDCGQCYCYWTDAQRDGALAKAKEDRQSAARRNDDDDAVFFKRTSFIVLLSPARAA